MELQFQSLSPEIQDAMLNTIKKVVVGGAQVEEHIRLTKFSVSEYSFLFTWHPLYQIYRQMLNTAKTGPIVQQLNPQFIEPVIEKKIKFDTDKIDTLKVDTPRVTVNLETTFTNTQPKPVQKISEKQKGTKYIREDLSKVTSISAGQMVEIFRKRQKKLKDLNIDVTLDKIQLSEIPDHITYKERSTDYMKQKLEGFYKTLEEEKQINSRRKRDQQDIVTQVRQQELAQKDKKIEEQELSKVKQKRKEEDNNNLGLHELGIKADGQSLGTGSQLGLGYQSLPRQFMQKMQNNDEKRQEQQSAEDLFDKFRQKQSQYYHQTAEERSYVREKLDICYKCNKLGHIARDCKSGLT